MKKVIYTLLISIISLSTALAQNRILDTNAEVGSLPGGVAVSPTGAATYNIPLEIPEGRAGMTPSISLNYNSQSGNGLLGVGWNIGGLSAISRGGNTFYHDDKVEGIKFTSDDGFFLDGQRLILISDGSWQDEYKTESESFSKIIAYHNGNNNPQRFKIWTKDGRILEYGFTNNSSIEPIGKTVPYQWKINNIEDRLGNLIQFTYLESNGAGLIYKIEYAENKRTNDNANYEINFIYPIMDIRIDPIINHVSGSTIKINKILDKIVINKNSGEILNTYKITYSDYFYSHIESIKLYSGDENSPYLNETIFDWGDIDNNVTEEIISEITPNVEEYFLDINGDGLTDIIKAFWVNEDNQKVYYNWNYKLRNSNGESFLPPVNFDQEINPKQLYLLPGDFNGDGLFDFAEVSLRDIYSPEKVENVSIERVFYSTGSTFVIKYISYINYEYENVVSYFASDFDGDAITDFLVVEKNKTTSNTHIWKHNMSMDFVRELSVTIDFGNMDISDAGVYLGDFNGNGKTDILRTAKYGGNPHTSNSFIYEFDLQNNQLDNIWGSVSNGYPNVWYRIYTGDFNNDGITDILTYNYYSASDWKASCFNGDGWVDFDLPPIVNFDPEDYMDQKYHGIALSDFNGDGTTDIIEFEKENYEDDFANYHIYYSNGSDFIVDNAPSGELYCIGGLNFNGGSGILKHYNNHFGNDFNGDRKSDLYKENGVHNDRVFLFDYLNNYDKIFAVTNGLGNRTTITYQPLTNNNIYSKGTNSQYPLTDIQAALYVVETLRPDKEFGEGLETNYHYSGARVHKLGKGFLGFKQLKITSNLSNTISYTNYDLFTEVVGGKKLYFMPYPKTIEQYSLKNGNQDKLLLRTTVDMDVIRTQEENSNLVFLPVTVSSLSHTWDNDTDHTFVKTSKSVQSIDDIDEYGNSKMSKSANDSRELTNVTPIDDYQFVTGLYSTYYESIDVPNWLISRPTSVVVRLNDKENLSDEHISRVEYEYYDNPSDAGFSLPKSINRMTVPIDQTEVAYYHSFDTKSDFEYDHYGHIIKETKSAPFAEPRLEDIVTEYKYDVSDEYNSGYGHRFLTRVITTSPGDNYVEQFVYDPVAGLVEMDISPSGLITTYEYGAFNRLRKTTFPDNTFVESSLIWTGQTTGQIYYSLQTDQNSANTFIYYDKFGRDLKTVVPRAWNRLTSYKKYNEKGQLYQVYVPKIVGNNLWTTFEYDNLGRVIKETLPTGNFINYSYKGLTTSTTDDNTGITTSQDKDALGRTIQVNDPTGIVKYNYFSSGNLKSVEANNIITQMDYDPAGNQKSLVEPNAGTSTYTYDAYGKLIEQIDGKGNHYAMEYDIMGRVVSRDLRTGSEQTKYDYNDDKSINGFGKLMRIDNKYIAYTYTYDFLGRLDNQTESFQGKNYVSQYSYNADGLVDNYTYPSDFKIAYEYYKDGSLSNVKNADTDKKLWELIGLDYLGQVSLYTLGNGLRTYKGHDEFGFLTEITTGNIQDLEYDFDINTGNLNWRKDQIFGLEETFTYDNKLKSRLETWQVTGLQQYFANYDNNGNFNAKTDVTDPRGAYVYGSQAGPHAITGILEPTTEYEIEASNPQRIEYTAFNKTERIDQSIRENKTEVNYTYGIEYGPDRARKVSALFRDYQMVKMKHYVGNYEVEIDADGNRRELHYISGGDGLFAIYVNNMGADTMYYVQKDHLGSPYCITGEDGRIILLHDREEQVFSFDPWGRRRKPYNWEYYTYETTYLFDRGFTGHEHLDNFGLINMNGRTYDPWLGRMMQPDNYVQAAGYLQNYNRYSYAINNPLKYTDPSGEIFWVPVVIGAVIGTYIGGTLANNDYNPTNWDYNSGKTWGYMITGAIVGGVSGGLAAEVAASSIPFANTAAIMTGSLTNSIGTHMYTGGQTDISIGFGIGAYNFSRGELGYLGKKGNSVLENIGYGIGTLANVGDILVGFNPGDVQLNTESSDIIGHSALTKVGETDPLSSYVSVGPDPGGKWIFNPFKYKNGTNEWDNYVNSGNDVSKVTVTGVNLKRIASYGARLDNGIKYNLYTSSCVNHTARALTLSGAPVIGIHPFILHAQMYLRSIGARPFLFSYNLYN